MTELAVELSRLRGWGDQVGRAGATMSQMGAEASDHISDGDFGRMLELVTGDYESMLPAFHALLPEAGHRLDATAVALREVAADYAETDRQVAQSFGVGAAITDDGGAASSPDVAGTALSSPSGSGVQLPEVTFGFPFDQACDLLGAIGLPDPREYVTAWIVGDVAKADRQAACWDHYADVTDAVRQNLEHGNGAVAESWRGEAATRASATMDAWAAALAGHAGGMRDMGEHLRDMVQQALDVAQTIVDTVKFFISLMAAAWSNAYIPIYGQIKLVEKVRDAFRLINDARRVLMVFWTFLHVVKDVITSLVHVFTAQGLPETPALPA